MQKNLLSIPGFSMHAIYRSVFLISFFVKQWKTRMTGICRSFFTQTFTVNISFKLFIVYLSSIPFSNDILSRFLGIFHALNEIVIKICYRIIVLVGKIKFSKLIVPDLFNKLQMLFIVMSIFMECMPSLCNGWICKKKIIEIYHILSIIEICHID